MKNEPPRIGVPPINAMIKNSGDHYMLTCVGPHHTINILHVGDVVRSYAELRAIEDYMQRVGYDVKHKNGKMLAESALDDGPTTVDVLILGVEESMRESLYDIMNLYVTDYGLIPLWDVLVYGPERIINDCASKRREQPVWSDQRFGLTGINLLLGHFKLRFDSDMRYWVGFFTVMVVKLEKFADGILGQNDSRLESKINKVGEKLITRGILKVDVMLFVKIAHILRLLRNTLAHSMDGMPTPEKEKKYQRIHEQVGELFQMAVRNKRRGVCVGINEYASDIQLNQKYFRYTGHIQIYNHVLTQPISCS